MEFISNSIEDTKMIAKTIAEKLPKVCVVAYYGGLGAGKTTLTSLILKNLGKNDVSSPTFSLCNDYGDNIYHFDMYRIKTFEDVYSTGFFDYLDNSMLFIEWSENIDNILPENTIKISIEILGETKRKITVRGL